MPFKLLNPTPNTSWCSLGTYPWECSKFDEVECIRGGDAPIQVLKGVFFTSGIIVIVGMVNVLICMGLIIHGASSRSHLEDNRLDTREKRRLEKQAKMYIGAFVILWLIPAFSFFVNNGYTNLLKSIILPLHGIFNSSIFIYHKVDNLKEKHSSMHTCQALCYIIKADLIIDQLEVRIEGISKVDICFARKNNRSNKEHSIDDNSSIAGASRQIIKHGKIGADAVISSNIDLVVSSKEIELSEFSLKETTFKFCNSSDGKLIESGLVVEGDLEYNGINQISSENGLPCNEFIQISSQDSFPANGFSQTSSQDSLSSI